MTNLINNDFLIEFIAGGGVLLALILITMIGKKIMIILRKDKYYWKKVKEPVVKSNCCVGDIKVEGITTHYYRCKICNEPCDVRIIKK